ncbi:MAG: NAD(P)/FAD-dependent oxidoreductase [Elainellaceae cyanobacterium]
MSSLYASDVYDRTHPIDSYWQSTVDSLDEGFTPLGGTDTCDIAIIGAGITGLTAALHLVREYGADVRVIEAGHPGWGASGRNGGFCCVGSTKLSDSELLQKFGHAETRRFYHAQRQGTELVQSLASQENIDIEAQGSGEIRVAHRQSRWQMLNDEYDFLTNVAQYPCELWSRSDLADQGFQSADAHAALRVGVGFGLNPLKYSLGLAAAVHRRGGVIYARSPVEVWEKTSAWHQLHTPGGTLNARHVIIATNGYTQDSLHHRLGDRLLPILSSIIVTRPLTQTERHNQGWHTETPIYDTRHLLFYYRLLPDGRCLFGSRVGTRGTFQERDRHRQWMIHRFADMFPAWRDVEITHSWDGLICVSAALTPHIGHLPDDSTVFYSLAYHGNGVAAATWCGQLVARLAVGDIQPDQLCAVYKQPLKKFVLPALRIWYLRSLYTAYQVKDSI